MPTVSLPILNAHGGGNVSAAGNAASHDKEGFQSLLNIGTPASGSEPRREHAFRSRPKDSDAAPVDAASKPEQPHLRPRDEVRDRKPPTPIDHDHSGSPEKPSRREPLSETSNDNAKPVEQPIIKRDGDAPAQNAGVDGQTSEATPAPAGQIALLPPAVLVNAASVENVNTEATAANSEIARLFSAVESIAPGIIPRPSPPISPFQDATTTGIPITAPVLPEDTALALTPETPLRIVRDAERLLGTLTQLLAVRDSGTIADSIGDITPGQRQALSEAIKLISDTLAAYKAGDIDNATLVQQLRPVIAELRPLVSRFQTLAAPPAVVDKLSPDAEATAATQKNEASPERAQRAAAVLPPSLQSSPPAPVVEHVTHASAQAHALATAIASSSGEGQANSGGNSAANQNLPQPVVAVRSAAQDALTKDVGAADFARTLSAAARPHQPVAEQVVFHIKTALKDGSSSIRIQLEPAELGKLDIKMQVDAGGKTGVTITVDNKSTLDLLQRDARGLERALADAGLTTDSGNLNFNLRGGDRQEQDAAQAAQTYRNIMPEEDAKPTDARTKSYVVNLSEGLDIRI